ncbi:putative aspartyl-tRNA synthetase [Cyclospora cayetanensis]|uniref:aspartate--tRNA ligase n=1 Tax=Cyclospora cayetanensis TaxID=88456 RepID=A0A1D3D4E5_9EIME|nr:putative aspartyl-tRNA synthetase [Cyclospora cayetanensis]
MLLARWPSSSAPCLVLSPVIRQLWLLRSSILDLVGEVKASTVFFAEAAAAVLVKESSDFEADSFGYWPLVQSEGGPSSGLKAAAKRQWVPVGQLDAKEGESVWVRGRLQDSRCKGSIAFVTLREGTETVQCVFGDSCSKDLLRWLAAVPAESLIDVWGRIVSPQTPVASTTQRKELQGEKVFCVVKAKKELPFQLKDAMQPEDEQKEGQIRVHLETRLDNRCLDLRVSGTAAVARVTSEVSRYCRDFLHQHGFVEIHTPKIIGGASEGGASCFRVPYFNRDACLAQSPQLYKQMCIAGDMGKVYEIGPVFRAENSNTHRHLCEFVGVDLEMEIKEDFLEAVEVIDNLFKSIFKRLEDSALIRAQHDVPPFVFLEETPRLTFAEGIKMLREAGIGVDTIPEDLAEFDLSTELEKALGRLVQEKYKTDYFFLLKYPAKVRPFYSMPCPNDPKYSNTFDVFMRGEEIASGAQRVHDAGLLRRRCEALGVPLEQLKSYIDAMDLGAPPHAGMGAGLERIVMLYYGLGNIRRVSLFPRDPKRLAP